MALSLTSRSRQTGTTVRGIYADLPEQTRFQLPKRHRTERRLKQWERFSGDPPLESIDPECFQRFRENGKAAGFSPSGLESTIRLVMTLLRFARDRGLIERLPANPRCAKKPRQVRTGPKPERRTKTPLTAENLNRILAAARTMPDAIEGIPARHYWPALILAIVDSGHYAAELLRLRFKSYDPAAGTLTIGRKIITLHAHTVNALEVIRAHKRKQLFPWWAKPADSSNPFDGLYRQYRKILHRAGLPPTERRAMIRLRNIALSAPDTLDKIDPYLRIQPVLGNPRRPVAKRPPVQNGNPRRDDRETLRDFFEAVYRPVRLAGRSVRTVEAYRHVINRFCDFLGCEAEFEHLTDESLNDFKAACLGKNTAETANRNLRHLFALWRYAWKKRRVTEQPRDVEFAPVMKTNPEAWSQQEMGRLLKAAAETQGEVNGIPARLFWPALIWFLYDTGLRIGAALMVHSKDFDLESGTVHVRPDHQKQKAAQVFRVHPDTLAALRQLDPAGREFLFNYPWDLPGRSKRNLFKLFDEVLERAGLPTDPKSKFHKIRRTCATVLADAVSDEAAMKHLGHSHISVTRAYLDRTKIKPRINTADVMQRPTPQG